MYGEIPGYAEFAAWWKAFPESLNLQDHAGFAACPVFDTCTIIYYQF